MSVDSLVKATQAGSACGALTARTVPPTHSPALLGFAEGVSGMGDGVFGVGVLDEPPGSGERLGK